MKREQEKTAAPRHVLRSGTAVRLPQNTNQAETNSVLLLFALRPELL